MGHSFDIPSSREQLGRTAPVIATWFEDIAIPGLAVLSQHLNSQYESSANSPRLFLHDCSPWPYFLAASLDYLPADDRIRYPVEIEGQMLFIQPLVHHQIITLRKMFESITKAQFSDKQIKLAPPVVDLQTDFGDPLIYTRNIMPQFSEWD